MNFNFYQIRMMLGVSLVIVLLSGCGQSGFNHTNMKEIIEQGSEISLNDDTITGTLSHVDTDQQLIHLDVTNWINRNNTSGEQKDIAFSYSITYNDNTIFEDDHGVISPDDFKIGEKLAIFPTPETEHTRNENIIADKIVKLTMSRQEKLNRVLAKSDHYHTVILYDEGTIPPYDEMDFDQHIPELFAGGISWIPYVEGLAIDYKKELNLETLPVIILFDRNGIVFQTDSLEQLKEWLNSIKT